MGPSLKIRCSTHFNHKTSVQVVKNDTTVHDSLRAAAKCTWAGFRHNYADVVLKLAGLVPVTREKAAVSTTEDGSAEKDKKKKDKFSPAAARKNKVVTKLEKIDE